MKKLLKLMMVALLVTGISAVAGEKKNKMSTRDVITKLKAAGEEHYPERMKVSTVGSIEVGETYYHAFCGTTKKEGYRVIFMDNKENYLGYYATDFEPADYDEEGVLIDSGTTNGDGDMVLYLLKLGSKGPADRVSINGVPSKFVRPKTEEKAATAEKAGATPAAGSTGTLGVPADSGAEVEAPSDEPQYRQWTIIRGGKEIPVKAVYVKKEKGKIYIKSAANGKTVALQPREISKADQNYVRELLKK